MTKVQDHMISLAVKRNDLKMACKLALMASIENQYTNLDNAYSKVRDHVTPKQWSGYLAALTKDGSYQPMYDFPGWGKML